MITIKGTVKNGQVLLDDPAALSEGTRVEVVPVGANPNSSAMDDEPMTPEEIAAVLAAMDQIEPEGWLSPEDEAAWTASLREQKEFEKARFVEDAEKLRRVWE